MKLVTSEGKLKLLNETTEMAYSDPNPALNSSLDEASSSRPLDYPGFSFWPDTFRIPQLKV
jgi:hypothetical protein